MDLAAVGVGKVHDRPEVVLEGGESASLRQRQSPCHEYIIYDNINPPRPSRAPRVLPPLRVVIRVVVHLLELTEYC